MKRQRFKTEDLPLAAFLRLQGYSILGIHTDNNGRATFSFEDRAERSSLVLQFFDRKTSVEPLALLEQVRSLKSLIRQR
jgi:hypothetical protein